MAITAEGTVMFHKYAQEEALAIFLPLLRSHLPLSNPLYNRLRAPQNTPSRHCLFAATFAPSDPAPPEYTIVFADRSRHKESQIWVFNPLITSSSELTGPQVTLLSRHVYAMVLYLKHIEIPEAPGWPFNSVLKFGCLHDTLARILKSFAEERAALVHGSPWNLWMARTKSAVLSHTNLLTGFIVARVPEDQLDIVLATSKIVRQKSTMLALPNVCILDSQKMVGWVYIGIDGSLATLYVQESYRGRGFAKLMARELLQRLGSGGFVDLGVDGDSGWAHADVEAGNIGSEGVMRSLGASVMCVSWYIWVDGDRF